MRTATLESSCECQAQLLATVDEQFRVLGGTAKDRFGRQEPAGAQRLSLQVASVDVGFACPFCGRTVLRSFGRQICSWVGEASSVSP